MINAAIYIYFLTFAVEGAARYYLALFNLETLLYVRDALLVALIGVLACRQLRPPVNLGMLALLLILVLHAIVGAYYVADLKQVAFGIKLLLPLILGFVLYRYATFQAPAFRYAVVALFLLVTVPVFINYFFIFPWEGFTYRVGDTEVVGAVKWWQGDGQKRLAGLSRTSFDAAVFTLQSAAFLVLSLQTRLLRIAVWLVAGIALYLTTTKGLIVAYACLSFLVVALMHHRNGKTRILQAILWLPASVMVLLPLYAFVSGAQINLENPIERVMLGSFAARVEQVWPEAFQNIANAGNFLLGRGIGGIGTPQFYWEKDLWNFGDNAFVYMYTSCGIFAFLYLSILLWHAQQLELHRFEDRLTYVNLFIFLVYGTTTAILESPLMVFALGLMYGHIYELSMAKRVTRRPSPYSPLTLPVRSPIAATPPGADAMGGR